MSKAMTPEDRAFLIKAKSAWIPMSKNEDILDLLEWMDADSWNDAKPYMGVKIIALIRRLQVAENYQKASAFAQSEYDGLEALPLDKSDSRSRFTVLTTQKKAKRALLSEDERFAESLVI